MSGYGKTLARNLLGLAQRIEELSSLLLLEDEAGNGTSPPSFLEDGEGLTSTRRLKKLVGCWVYLQELLLPKIPKEHPFLKAQELKMATIKKTILIDLTSALKEARIEKDDQRCLSLMILFADMGAEKEVVKALKEAKR